MKHTLNAICLFLAMAITAGARDYHVSPGGNDAADGSTATPLKTINRAAQLALPGDTVTVHGGVYREWVNPLNGGESDRKRILYRAADGEEVEVKGSEIVTGWKRDKKNKRVWTIVLPNSFFGDYNPFNDRLYGDWLWSSKIHHTADVFLNDVSLYETYSLDKVYAPDTARTIRDPEGCSLVWFAEVDGANTTIHANFGTTDPNRELTEVSVRPTCFYPTREGLNYITIRGFKFNQAATQWAAPTAEQVGMVATHWGKGWIIENNIIRNSRANGITLGKERATGHNLDCHDKRLDGTLHYIEVVFNTLRRGWDKDNIGAHIVRNNIISDCEQTGICGSMGGAFSEIYGNHIYNILCKQQFNGAEMAGIKLHGAIDTHIHDNIIHNSGNYGIWLDWMAQGSHVSSNTLYDNVSHDLFFEVDHGPYIVDNNIALSPKSLAECSDGGAFLHNIFAGSFVCYDDSRYTPYQLAHSTQVKGISILNEGDHRFYGNIFAANEAREANQWLGSAKQKAQYGLEAFNASRQPIYAEDNIFCHGTSPMKDKTQGREEADAAPRFRIEETAGGIYLVSDFSLSRFCNVKGSRIDTDRLGTARLTGYPFENPDGSPFVMARDYLGKARNTEAPVVGPFETTTDEKRIKIWPKQ